MRSLKKNFMQNRPKRAIIKLSATTGGMKLFTRLPIVEPYSTFGIIMLTMLKSTRLVFFDGWRLGIKVMKLYRAVPRTRG